MEQRHHARIAVNLNVALLDDHSLPRTCRVRDVSQSGMLLQFDRPGGAPFERGQGVKIRASLKDGDSRRVLLLSARVTRVEEKAVGVTFLHPEAELMQLLEAYSMDRPLRQALPLAAGEATGAAADPPRQSPGRARLARRLEAARQTIMGAGPSETDGATTVRSALIGERRLLQLGMGALALALVVIVFSLAAGSATQRRLAAVEASARQQAAALAEVQIRLQADGELERLARLDNQVRQLAISVAALETGQLTPGPAAVTTAADSAATPMAQAQPIAAVGVRPAAEVETVTPRSDARGGADVSGRVEVAGTQPAHAAPIESAGAGAAVGATTRVDTATTGTAGAGTAGTGTAGADPADADATVAGPWVINLVSLFDAAAAARFQQRARAQGIEVRQNRTQINGRPVWRLQVEGFASHAEAVAFSQTNKHKLGIDKVWIFQR